MALKVVTVFGKKSLQYRLLDVLEFDSNRKCMSVIIQPVLPGEMETPYYIPEKPALVLCKGADSSILNKVCSLETFLGHNWLKSLTDFKRIFHWRDRDRSRLGIACMCDVGCSLKISV